TDKWAFTIPILQILCVWGAFYPINQLCTNLIISRGHSRLYMYGTIALGITQLLIVFLTFRFGILPMIMVFACVNISWLFVWQFFLNKMVGLRLWELLRDIVPFALISVIVMIATYWITSALSDIYLLFAAKIVVAALLYMLLLWWADARIFKESVRFLLKKWK
ncbi:MAG: polysaccharide biosynthesis C-terminal domain-containing protein, partial [Bacteroidales bacterium]